MVFSGEREKGGCVVVEPLSSSFARVSKARRLGARAPSAHAPRWSTRMTDAGRRARNGGARRRPAFGRGSVWDCLYLSPSCLFSLPHHRNARSLSLCGAPTEGPRAATRKRSAQTRLGDCVALLPDARERQWRGPARAPERERKEEESGSALSPDTLGFSAPCARAPPFAVHASAVPEPDARASLPVYGTVTFSRPPSANSRSGARGRAGMEEGRGRRWGCCCFCARGGQLQRGALSRLLLKVAEGTQLGSCLFVGVARACESTGKRGRNG